MQGAPGAGDGDVGQAAFLGLGALAHGATVGEEALLDAGDPHVIELQAPGAMDRHDARRLALVARVTCGQQESRDEVAKLRARRARLVGAREPHELPQPRERTLCTLALVIAAAGSEHPLQGLGVSRGDEGATRWRATLPGRRSALSAISINAALSDSC